MIALFSGVLFLLAGCKKTDPTPVPQPVVTSEYIKTYDLQKLNQILNGELEFFLAYSTMHFADFQGQFATPKYPVKLYRVTYPSVVPELGIPTIASGLVAIPETGLDSMPVISYQHGTVFEKDYCPSVPDSSMETKLMIAQFASQGYIVIGADYFGLGVSDLPNSYLIERSSEQACVDMLYAAQKVLKDQNIKQGSLFLHGWSQGGYTNMAFLRTLETLNVPVTAASTASAPADAFSVIDRWINNPQPGDAPFLPACLSNFLFSMEYYNNLPGLAASAINADYYQAAKDFYQWNMDFPAFFGKTTPMVREYLKPEFMTTGNLGNTTFWRILENYQVYRWRCHTPLRMYYGGADEVVPVYLATLPAAYQQEIGCTNIVALPAGLNADHRATYIYSLIHAKPWFDGFLK